MASCKDLLKLNIFKHIHLIAGKNGLYRSITWPYICQSIDFYKWINGQEVLFLTGVGMSLSEKEFEEIIYKCKEKSISALIILTNSEFIPYIPTRIINLCNTFDLPLFEMPWNLKIIDVSKEISNFIMKENNKINIQKELFKELIYSNNFNKSKVNELLYISNINRSKYYFCVTLNFYKINSLNIDYILIEIENNINSYSNTFIFDVLNDDIVIIIGTNSSFDCISIKQRLKIFYNEMNLKQNCKLILGDVYDNILDIRESYNNALNAFELYKYNNWNYDTIDYSDLGFYKILFEVNSIKKLGIYSHEIIGPLIDPNDKNSLNLLNTLRCYLLNDCNLLKTSNELFIHRNTLIYRLNKIKGLLGNNLDNALYKNNLLNAIMIKDYLNYAYRKNNEEKHFEEETNDFNG